MSFAIIRETGPMFSFSPAVCHALSRKVCFLPLHMKGHFWAEWCSAKSMFVDAVHPQKYACSSELSISISAVLLLALGCDLVILVCCGFLPWKYWNTYMFKKIKTHPNRRDNRRNLIVSGSYNASLDHRSLEEMAAWEGCYWECHRLTLCRARDISY